MSLSIGKVRIENPFVLAPMAGVNCASFRLMCRKSGAGLVYTQMVDADVLAEKNKDDALKFLNILKDEKPVNLQLIGLNTKNLEKSVEMAEDAVDMFDYNIGCMEDDYAAKGMGADLLKYPEKIEKIVSFLRGKVNKPLTAKIRIGWDDQHINAVKICKILENIGVDAIAVHGRTATQKYSGKVNWTAIKQIREKANIPIIANGDIQSGRDAVNMLEKTGCQFVMIGREAMHNPAVFKNCNEILKNIPPSKIDFKKQVLDFIDLYKKNENRISVSELRTHVFWLCRDIKTKENTKMLYGLDNPKKVREFVGKL